MGWCMEMESFFKELMLYIKGSSTKEWNLGREFSELRQEVIMEPLLMTIWKDKVPSYGMMEDYMLVVFRRLWCKIKMVFYTTQMDKLQLEIGIKIITKY